MENQILKELIDAEALAIMQEEFIDLESMVLEGQTFGDMATASDQPIQVTGLQDIDDINLKGFESYAPEDLFDAAIMPNKIEIFESEDSYAFVMLTQKIEPAVQPFIEIADLAIAEVRAQKANEVIEEFSQGVEDILNGSKPIPQIAGITNETFKNVKRFSSLLPAEVISETFESSIGSLVSSTSFNGDKYWAKSSNEMIPSKDELGDSIEQYKGFYNDTLSKQFSGFIDKAFKQNQKIRLDNFGPS